MRQGKRDQSEDANRTESKSENDLESNVGSEIKWKSKRRQLKSGGNRRERERETERERNRVRLINAGT